MRAPRPRSWHLSFALLVVALVSLSFLAACSRQQPVQEQQPDVQTASFIRDLVDQNTQLRDENDQLRGTLLQYSSVITEQNATLASYFDQLRQEANRSRDLPHPYARIPLQDVHVYNSRVVIDVPGAIPVLLADTHSMDPLADNDSKVIAVAPQDERDIYVGDIVGYHCSSCNATEVIMHRVVAIGTDSEGTYYTLKGDNNVVPDPDKVRFSQIRTVVVGIIY